MRLSGKTKFGKMEQLEPRRSRRTRRGSTALVGFSSCSSW